MNVLVTGGAGYIGSHACVELIELGYDVIVVDNLCNSSKEAIFRVERITGVSIRFYEMDVRNEEDLSQIFESNKIDGVIHFAGLKSVSESMTSPMEYFSNNVAGSLSLLKVMARFGCKNIIFSSSATVYGIPVRVPIKENARLDVLNPYGESKLMVEQIFRATFAADKSWSIALLRYFNPVGAHESGLIGEDPTGIPNNLMPFIMRVASGKYENLKIFGGDYDTDDGTGVRDYIHVVDLVKAHIKALNVIINSGAQILTANLGRGSGVSVLDLVRTVEEVSGKNIRYEIVGRREGDAAISFADPSFANRILSWNAERSLVKICEDAWRWQCMNPNGYLD